MEKIYLVFYVTKDGGTFTEICFKDHDKAINYCKGQQAVANELKKDKNYLYKEIELRD